MAEKRAKKAEEEAKEHKVNESIRRKAGKVSRHLIVALTNIKDSAQDMSAIKQELQVKEAMKEAEQKKRGMLKCTHKNLIFTRFLDKIADAKAKAAVKAQIEADKKARAEKAAREKALRDGQPLPESSTSAPAPAAASTSASGVAGRDFKETRLQIRMATGGPPYTITLSSDARK